jgi:septum formation protein
MTAPLVTPIAGSRLVLASASPYRRALLERLQLPFTVQVPEIDETPRPHETPLDTVQRLASAKAHAIAAKYPSAFVIGSDQVVDIDGAAVSKPGDHEHAYAQLRALSARTCVFHTALCVTSPTGQNCARVVDTVVRFRTLNDATITAYLARERPYDCAGSVKAESLGIALLAQISSDDPTALIGLPLIALVDLLTELGFAGFGHLPTEIEH